MLTERSVMTKMLLLYRDNPCLWNTTHESYRNREERQKAITLLLDKWKLIEPDANQDTMKKKLENMRATFMREWRKVVNSKAAGTSSGYIYKPSLWYYDLLTFLVEDSTKYMYSPDICKIDVMSENLDDDTSEEESKTRDTKRRKTELHKKQAKHSNSDQNSIAPEGDPTTALCHAFALQLKEMSKVQRCIAEKMISEVLFYGKLDLLTVQSSIAINGNDDSIKPSGSTYLSE